MNRWSRAGWLGALVAAGILGLSLPGAAQKKGAARPDAIFGFVDLTSVTDAVKKTPEWQQSVRKFEDEKARYKNELEALGKLRYLTTTERTELQNLRAKQKPTDAEKARIQELDDRSGKLDQEYQALAMISELTAEQRTRLRAVQEMREKGVTQLQDETNKRMEALQRVEAEVLQGMQDRILRIVGQVADSRGIVMVVDRQFILYGGQDLTEDVLKKLGK